MSKDNTLLHDILSEQSTEQLDERLAVELHKEQVDEEAVRTILAVLREREKDEPVEITPEIQKAWEKYQKDIAAIPRIKPKRIPTWLVRAASVCVVMVLLFTMIPTNAQADNFWKRLVRWTDEMFEFFSPHEKEAAQQPYVFGTDHPGLQQIYDKVLEMGITEPVVPMWLPEGYGLAECRVYKEPECGFIHAKLLDGNSEIIIEIRQYTALIPGQYEKSDEEIKELEFQGIVHFVMRNNNKWNVAWTKDNMESFITIDCQENILYDILRSIYTMEEGL